MRQVIENKHTIYKYLDETETYPYTFLPSCSFISAINKDHLNELIITISTLQDGDKTLKLAPNSAIANASFEQFKTINTSGSTNFDIYVER